MTNEQILAAMKPARDEWRDRKLEEKGMSESLADRIQAEMSNPEFPLEPEEIALLDEVRVLEAENAELQYEFKAHRMVSDSQNAERREHNKEKDGLKAEVEELRKKIARLEKGMTM